MTITWHQLLGIQHSESEETQQGQRESSRKLMIFFIPILMGFMLFNWSRDHQLLAFVEAIVVCLLLVAVTWVAKAHPHILPRAAVTIVFTLGLVVFIDGGVGQMAFLWMVMIPFIYFTLLEQRWGWLCSALFLVSILLIKNVSDFDIIYNQTQMAVFVLAFLVQTHIAASMNFFRMHREHQLINREQEKHQQLLKIEETAQHEKMMWQESIDCIDDVMMILDADGVLIQANKAAKRLSLDDISTENPTYCHQLLNQQCQSCDHCPLETARKERRSVEDKIFIKATKQWYHISVQPLKAIAHSHGYSLLTLKDITLKHHREAARKIELHHLQSIKHISEVIVASEDAHTVLFNLMAAIRVIFHADRAWLLTPCDPEAESYTIPVESASDDYPGAFLEMRNIPMNEGSSAVLAAALATDKAVTFPTMPDIEAVRKYSIQSQMVLAIHGNVGTPWLLGIHQCSHATDWDEDQRDLFEEIGSRLADIVDAWRLNETLQRRTDQYKQLVENMPDAVIILLDQKIIFANEVMLNMVGADSMDDFRGKGVEDFIHPDSQKLSKHDFSVVIKEKKNPIHEICLINKEGDKIDVISNSMPISYHGKPAVQVIMRDVTRRNKMDHELKQSLIKNKQLARQVINVQEQERITLAQNLHDDSGQLLTAMSVNLQSIKNHVKEEKIMLRIEDTEMMIDRLFTSIRSSLETLNPTHIDTLGLTEAIRSEVEMWSFRHPVKVIVEVSKEADFPCPETATAIFRVIQEGLTNIAKHAQAKHVWIQLKLIHNHPTYISLEIRDDGCGFDPQSKKSKGFGLFGMLSRTELVSGVFTIHSKIDRGTTLHADFPMHPSEEFDATHLLSAELGGGNIFRCA